VHRQFVNFGFNRNQPAIACRVHHKERDRKTHLDTFATDKISYKLHISFLGVRYEKNEITESSHDRRHSRFKISSILI